MKVPKESWLLISNWVPYKWFADMEELAKLSNFDGRERAFTICEKDGDIEKSGYCKGTQCTVNPPECEPQTKDIGYYHTHPHAHDEFSIGDSNYSLEGKRRIQCVGTVVETKITTKEGSIEVPEFRVKCRSWDVTHPDYEFHRNELGEVASKLHRMELNFGKAVYEENKSILPEEWNQYKKDKTVFSQKLESAEKAGVAIKEWGSQGIDESFGTVKRRMVELIP